MAIGKNTDSLELSENLLLETLACVDYLTFEEEDLEQRDKVLKACKIRGLMPDLTKETEVNDSIEAIFE